MPDCEELRKQLARDGVLMLSVKVTPRASKSEVLHLMEDGSLKVKLAAVPEKGQANEELRRVLAEYFGVAKKKVELVSGGTSQHKRLRISR